MWRFLTVLVCVLALAVHVSAQELSTLTDNRPGLSAAYTYEGHLGKVKIKVYLKDDEPGLAKNYIDYTRKYLREFQSLLGPFPYDELNIVETDRPMGVSFPRYILFGSAVIRLPFILESSLPHEIVHQWFGSLIEVDSSGGNWSEGLTTYLADHRMSELKGRGALYRKRLILDYVNYRKGKREITLKDFTERTDDLTKAVGYGKGAMVFHMLRRKIGDELFFKGLREFVKEFAQKRAGWDDLRKTFERVSGISLKDFFYYWVNKRGAIGLKLESLSVLYRKGRYVINLSLKQAGDISYNFELPVRIYTEEGIKDQRIKVETDRIDIKLYTSSKPYRIVIDPDYDLFRIPFKEEIPPLVSALKDDQDARLIYPEAQKELYREVIEFYKKRGIKVVSDREFRFSQLKEHSFIILSSQNHIFRMAFDGVPDEKGDFYLKVFENLLNRDRYIMLIDAVNADAIKRAFHKIGHYGNYSELAFSKGKNILKRVDQRDMGVVVDLSSDFQAVRPADGGSIDDVVKEIKNSRVVYIGEDHLNYNHHIIQFEIIRRLYEINKKLVIGMEMFQRPFQKYLDQFIQGKITEAEMLKKTEYFKRWVYDYNLYRDIIQFARAKGIPLVALNIKKEIVDKVSQKGIDALTPEERALLPRGIDLDNDEYLRYLRMIFSRHSKAKGRNFENFYFSQLIWDETMADSVVKALDKYPDAQMVVIAGNGHIRNAWGIPSRVKRKRAVSFSIIVNGSEGGENRLGKGVADYVFYTKWAEPPASPKIGVLIKKTEDGVEVERVTEGSPADRAGITAGSVILSVDGKPVRDVDDLRIYLLDKSKGDTLTLRLKNRLLFFSTVSEVRVKL